MNEISAGRVRVGRLLWGVPAALLLTAVITLCTFLLLGWPLMMIAMRLGGLAQDLATLIAAAAAVVVGAGWGCPGALTWAAGYQVDVNDGGITIHTLFGKWRFGAASIQWLASYGHTSEWFDVHQYERSGQVVWRSSYTSGVAFGTSRGAVVIDASCVGGGGQLPAAFEQLARQHGLRFDRLDYTPKARSLHPVRRLFHETRRASDAKHG